MIYSPFRLMLSLMLVLSVSEAIARDYYQLKIFTLESEQQAQDLDQHLKEAYLPALHRAGIKHVGVFKPLEADSGSGSRVYVLVPFASLEAFAGLDQALEADSIYQESGRDYLNASHENPPYKRIESILLRAFASMPEHGVPDHSTPPSQRIYELRSYEGATEKLYQKKVEMFNEGGESRIFIDLGFQPIFFGEVISGSSMPNLMYLTTFANKDSQDQHWQAFREAPAWQELRKKPEYQNTVSHNEKTFLRPTDYSDL